MIRRHLAVWVTHPWAAPAVVIAAAVGLGTVVVAARWGWHPDYHWAGSPDSDVTVATLALMLLAVAPVYGLLAPSRRRPAPGRRHAAPARWSIGRARHPNSGPARPTTAQHGHLPAVVFRAGRCRVAGAPLAYGAGAPADQPTDVRTGWSR